MKTQEKRQTNVEYQISYLGQEVEKLGKIVGAMVNGQDVCSVMGHNYETVEIRDRAAGRWSSEVPMKCARCGVSDE